MAEMSTSIFGFSNKSLTISMLLFLAAIFTAVKFKKLIINVIKNTYIY